MTCARGPLNRLLPRIITTTCCAVRRRMCCAQGVAHLTEHVTFLGSRRREALLGTGARANAYTDFHHTVFHVHAPLTNGLTGRPMLPQARRCALPLRICSTAVFLLTVPLQLPDSCSKATVASVCSCICAYRAVCCAICCAVCCAQHPNPPRLPPSLPVHPLRCWMHCLRLHSRHSSCPCALKRSARPCWQRRR